MPIDVDFANIRPWGRGQDTGFEELCCQIARAQALQRGDTFVRLGTPDGGVEGYSIDASGTEHGIQAKFFLGSPSTSQWSEITGSVKTAIGKHPKLTAMTIALPSDRSDPRKPQEQWFMDKWDHYVGQWQNFARSIGRRVEFHYMGKSEIFDALSREEHAGRSRWWFDRSLLSRRWLANRLDEVSAQVGPRYNRDLTVGVAAGRKIANFARLPHLLIDLEQHAASAVEHIGRLARAVGPTASARLHDLARALPTPVTSRQATAPDEQPPVDQWRQAWQALQEATRALSVQAPATVGSVTQQIHQEVSALTDLCAKAISTFDEDWPAYLATALLLWGDAGSGKTHLLCDTTRLALERGQPAVLVLGQQLGVGNPWAEVMKAVQFDGEADTFLQALTARAEASQQRALLIIDAINENNGLEVWPHHLATFLTVARRFPWVGVILSVRTVAKDMILPEHLDESRLLQVNHEGFKEAPSAAVRAFFDYYKLPLPTAPPSLSRELSNPLLLRLFCQAARSDTKLLSRPTPGLSRIVEAVFKDVDKRAQRQLGTGPYQAVARPCCEAVAAEMFKRQQAVLPRADAIVVLQNVVPTALGTPYAKTPLGVLASEGLLAEDFVVAEDAGPPSRVVRFAFERIGDHIAAERLLADGFDVTGRSTADVADEVARRLPVVDLTTWSPQAYRLRALLEALAVVAPEHVGVELPQIADAMKRAGATIEERFGEWVITEPWLRGLPQRESSSFTDSTRQQLEELILGPDLNGPAALPDMRRRDAITTALLLAVHPDQPLGAGWLRNLLAPMAMTERDRRWTSQIGGHRRPRDQSPYGLLIGWARSAPSEVLTVSVACATTVARLTAEALMWALPSPDRFLRDAASRAIVAITEHDPQIVPGLLRLATGIDDGYLTERVLAVAFAAIAMRTAPPQPVAAALREFVERAGVPIHVLARDYLAAAVARLAEMLPDNLDIAYLRTNAMPPYPANWPGPLGLPDFQRLKAEHSPHRPDPDNATAEADPDQPRKTDAVVPDYHQIIRSLDKMGDFRIYVVHADKPYSFRIAAQRIDDTSDAPLAEFNPSVFPGWIFARVLELGWTPQAFSEVDREIRQFDRLGTSHKEERFGKKYQWLAWHEALARVSGTYKMRDLEQKERETPYKGAWQLDARDFDPTHLLDRLPPVHIRWWQELWQIPALAAADATVIADKATDDGPVTVTRIRYATTPPPWWLPVSEVPHPAVPLDQDPLVHLSRWVADATDLPDLSRFVVVDAELTSWTHTRSTPARPGRRYRVLSAFRHLTPPRADRTTTHADLIASIDGVLIRRDDLPALHTWTGAINLDEHALDVSFTDEMYLGEWPTAAVYRANTDPGFRPERWTDAIGTDAIKLGIPAIVMTERYCWEGNIQDCSLPETLNVHILTCAPAALFPGLRHHNGTGITADGQLLHLDPEPWPGSKGGGLLIDETLLTPVLEREGLVLLQIIRQSKHVNTPDGDHRFAGRLMQTRLIASQGTEQLCDITRTHRDPPRLDELVMSVRLSAVCR